MKVQYRLDDVKTLKAHILQDYLKLVIIPQWQEPLYKILKKNTAKDCKFRNSYIGAYEKMRDLGVNNYSIDDMDVTIIYQILKYERSIRCDIDREILNQLRYVKNGRNDSGHFNGNEPDEDLYLFGLLDLVELRYFVVYVDKYSDNIDDGLRQKYRQKYAKEIDDLKRILDDERIQLVQRHKEMDALISEVFTSDNPLKKWCEIVDFYNSKRKLDKSMDGTMELYIRASDAGVPYAHIQAGTFLMDIKKDYANAERHFLMVTEKSDIEDHFTDFDARTILGFVNSYLSHGNRETAGIKRLIDFLNNIYIVQFVDTHYEIPTEPPIQRDIPFNNSCERYARRNQSN